MNDWSRIFKIEKQLIFIRIVLTTAVVIAFLSFETDPMLEPVKYLSIACLIYSIVSLPLLTVFQKKVNTLSKVFAITDILFITAVQCFTGIDPHLTQLYLIFIISASLRFSFQYVLSIASASVFLMFAAHFSYHMNFGDGTNVLNQIVMHFQWVIYIALTTVISGIIMQEVKKDKLDNAIKGQKLFDAKMLVHKLNMFLRKVNQAEQLLAMREYDVESFMSSVTGKIAGITGSTGVYLIVFGKSGEVEYFTCYPEDGSERPNITQEGSKEYNSLLRFLIDSFPNGMLANDVSSHPIYSEIREFLCLYKNVACGTAALKNGSNIIVFASNNEYEYTEVDLSMMQSFCLHIGFALEKKERSELYLKKSIMENDLKITAEIQKILLPNKPLEIGNICVSGFNSPSSYVCGDYVDYFVNKNGILVTVIADIMGGGLPSGFISLGLRSALRVIAEVDEDPGRILDRLNKHICECYGDLNCFITMGISAADFERNLVRTSSAGHFPPMVWVDKEFLNIGNGEGIALGIEENAEYASTEFEIKRKVLVVSYTDGITEAVNVNQERFGKERLKKAVEEYLAETDHIDNEALMNKIKADVCRFTGKDENDDDWSLLINNFR